MGQLNSSDRFTIAFNKKLNTRIIQTLNIHTTKSEVNQFKRFLNKKFQKQFTPSGLSQALKAEGNALKTAMQLIDIIYSKAVKVELKQSNNLNVYCDVFNYNLIPKESIEYERFNRRNLASFEHVLSGEAHNYELSLCNSSMNSPSAREKEKASSHLLHSDSLFSKSKLLKVQSGLKANDTSSENEIISSMLDVNSMKQGSTFRSNRFNKASSNKKGQAEDTETINLADESFNNLCITEERHFDHEESEHVIEFDPNLHTQKLPSPQAKKKKHRALPTKAPVVNIKLKINDLVKQGIYESAIESSTLQDDSLINKPYTGKNKFRFNKRNAYHLNISTNIEDVTVIKPDSSVANVNDNSSFLSIVDAFTQANKKTRDVIHSRTPAKSKVMKLPNYLKSAPKSSEKNLKKKKEVEYCYKFNF